MKDKEDQSPMIKNILEFFDAGLEISKIKQAERIVNQYAKALFDASEYNKKKVKEFLEKIKTENLNKSSITKQIEYQLQNKFDSRFLKNSKYKIKRAIEYLLKNEEDIEKAEKLKTGLLLLEDFIDYNEISKKSG